MNSNKLKLNEDKTEFLIAGTSHQHAKVMINSLSISGAIMPASPCDAHVIKTLVLSLTVNLH